MEYQVMEIVAISSVLSKCMLQAEICLDHCLRNNNEECVECGRLCLDCADFCNFLIRLKARDSKQFLRLIPLGIESCKECMLACERMPGKPFQDCATACADAINELRYLRS